MWVGGGGWGQIDTLSVVWWCGMAEGAPAGPCGAGAAAGRLWGCLVAAPAFAWGVCCAGVTRCVTPLWGVEAAGEGLHAQDAEDDEGHDAYGSVDAKCRGQRLAGDSCCAGGAAAVAGRQRVWAAGNIGTAPGCPWMLAEAASGSAGRVGCTVYRRLARKPPNQSWTAGCCFMALTHGSQTLL